VTAKTAERQKLYIKLTNDFLDKIRSGEWKPGRQIPTEEELCKSFNVSKITVRRAVANLVFDGQLERIQGKGTFVRHDQARPGMSMKTTLVEGVFLPGGIEDITVIEKSQIHGMDEQLLMRMGPVNDVNIHYISRVKSKEGVPVLLNETYVPVRMCPKFADWDAEGGSVLEFLREHSTAPITKVVQTVEMRRPPEYRARALNSRPTMPCLVIHRVFRDDSGLTVAYSRTTARGDRFELLTEYERVK